MINNGHVPLLDLAAQHAQLGREIEERVLQVLRSGQYVGGLEVAALEEEFAAYCGSACGVAVNSGTAALHVALLALGIGPGDEVITVAHTFVATVEAITAVGARPVLVDIDPETYTLDPHLLQAAITPRTKAIIPVHLYGQTADMAPILELARAHDIAVVEDACQAHGALYRGQRAGALGDIGCFSFYPSKNLGSAGEGGIAVTDSPELAARMRSLREHGQASPYQHEAFGFNYRLPAIQAAVLRVKLPHLDAWNQARQMRAATYAELLSELDITLPGAGPERTHVYHLYVIRSGDRERLREHLRLSGIATGVHYPLPVHLQTYYRHLADGPGSLPCTEAVVGEIVSLPMYPELTRGQQRRVADALLEFAGLNATGEPVATAALRNSA